MSDSGGPLADASPPPTHGGEASPKRPRTCFVAARSSCRMPSPVVAGDCHDRELTRSTVSVPATRRPTSSVLVVVFGVLSAPSRTGAFYCLHGASPRLLHVCLASPRPDKRRTRSCRGAWHPSETQPSVPGGASSHLWTLLRRVLASWHPGLLASWPPGILAFL